MAKSWEEVKSVLDDPYVSADTKEALLAAYVMENGDDASSEAEDYLDGTKAEYNLKGDFPFVSTDDAYDAAQEESEESGYSARLNDEGVEDGRTTIEDMQAPAEGSSTGVETSNEIFDAARKSLRIFEDFLPVNDKVPGDQLGRYGKIKLEDIQTRYDEQMGISFKNFLDDAARLRAAFGTLDDLNGSTEGELNSLYKQWTGPAANASYQHWSEKLAPPIKDLLEYLEASPDMIGTAVTNIFTACKDKANDIIALYQNLNGTMGSATPEMAMKVVNLANGDFGEEDHDKVLEVAAWVDSMTGSNLESTIRNDDCDMNEENREYIITECKKWIRDSFNEDLHENVYVNFKQACDDALEAVDSHYETLNNYLKEYENKFGEALPPGSETPPPGSETPPPGSNTPPPGSSTPPPGSSTPPPGSTDPSASAPPPISTPPPSSTSPSSVPPLNTDIPGATNPSGTNPSSTMPGVNTPGSSTPGAIDPVTGLPTGTPGSSMPGGGAPKEVTIKDGNRTITVGQPDVRGRSKVTVDDGEGEPREYEVDFTPDEPGETYENDDVIKAGPDGKVQIQDGDATLTLEQPPGKPDQMKMTVDDGTPATYDFDFDAGTDIPSPGLTDAPTPGAGGGSDLTGPGGAGGGGAGGGGIGGGGGFGGAETPGTSAAPSPGAMVGANAPDTGAGAERGGAASPAAASAGAGGPGGQHGGMMGGMPMGGMGGAGGGQGGDQTRQSKWRTTGSIFDDVDPAANFSGVVGRDPSEKPKTPKR